MSRADLDGLVAEATELGAKGLVWAVLEADGWRSPVAKFLSADEVGAVNEALGASEGDVVLLVADEPLLSAEVLGELRRRLGERLGLIDTEANELTWIVDWPLLGWAADEERWERFRLVCPSRIDLPTDARGLTTADAETLLDQLGLLDAEPEPVELVLTLGMALFLSALTVHFRDIQNILSHVLHLWFFATPVIYSYAQIAEGTPLRRLLRLNPMTHVVVTYQQMLFHGNVDHWRGLVLSLAVGVVAFAVGAFLFDRLRDTLAEEV